MIQQQMFQPQINQIFQQQMEPKKEKKNIFFKNDQGNQKNIIVDSDATVKEILNEYMDTVFGYENEKIVFILNAMKLNRNDKRKIKDVWSQGNAHILVHDDDLIS